MEAQCALLFDTLGWKWEYEPESIMLPNGVAYRPDFWLPEFRCIVECRGYDSEKGRQQIQGFRDLLDSGGVDSSRLRNCGSYLTIGPDHAKFFWCNGSHILSDACIAWCHICLAWAPSGVFLEYCDRCLRECTHSESIEVCDGKISIHGFNSGEWATCELRLSDHLFNQQIAIRNAVGRLRQSAKLVDSMISTPDEFRAAYLKEREANG